MWNLRVLLLKELADWWQHRLCVCCHLYPGCDSFWFFFFCFFLAREDVRDRRSLMGLYILCDVWGTCSQKYWTHKCAHLPWSHWEGDKMQDTAMSQWCRVTPVTAEWQQKGWFFLNFAANMNMGSALTDWKRSWTFAGLVFMQTPFASCFAEILDILGCCSIWGADPARAVCSVSCLHHSTATLSSTSLPFKHEGEIKLNVHIWGRWLAPVLQWYLREIFFMLFQQHRRKWKCFLL